MAVRADARAELLRGIHVIDGGLASELEYLGARIDGALRSARVLEDEPEKVAPYIVHTFRRVPSALQLAATRFRAWAMPRSTSRRSAQMAPCFGQSRWPAQ